MNLITSFEIKYETAASIPPPFCYYYHIQGTVTPTELQITFEWVYHNREDISQEELEDEGFTDNDDFAWQGSLSRNWLVPLEQLLRKSNPGSKSEEETIPFLELDFQEQKGLVFRGSPDNIPEWDYFLQEFIQSIYETSGKEAPLLIRYKKISSEQTLFCSVRMQFTDRTVQLQSRVGDAKLQQKSAHWDTMKQVLEQIFTLSYIAEKAEKREPHQPGTYIDAGENMWYEFGKSVFNPSLKIDTLADVSRFFDKLIKNR